MKASGWIGTALAGWLWGTGGLAGAMTYPDGYPVKTGAAFQPLESSCPDRPDWLLATARGVARAADGSGNWAMYEWVLDRRLPFHHLLVELLLVDRPGELYLRLLDGRRQLVTPDVFGNVAERAEAPGNVFLSIPLADYPAAEVVQLLVPLADESALHRMMLTPASYEILMRTGSDFVSGAKSWIRTPVFDPKKIGLLSDLVLLEEGRLGDMSSPVSAFQAYGVDARELAVAAEPGAGVEFALDAMPLLARFDVALRNFDPLAPPELWLNGHRLGALSLDLPDLEEAASWPSAPPDTWRMGRWTRAWFYVPPETLRMGDNRLDILSADGIRAPDLEVRDAGLQLKYPWEEIGTYSFVSLRASTRDEPVAGGISPAPAPTARQEDDAVVLRVDSGQFQPIGPGSAKPDWLAAVDREFPEPGERPRQYRIQLNPANRPAQLGIDIVSLSGLHAPVTVSLLAGDRMLAPDLLRLNLNSGYVQMTTQILVPLHDHPEADTVLLHIGAHPGWPNPTLSRLQLKPSWPAAVLASGQAGTEGALADMQYDSRSAFIPAETVVPGPDGSTARRQHLPPMMAGEWYGVETRVLHEGIVKHGDNRKIYFTDWEVEVDRAPLLARVDLLVMHISVVDGLEVFVNGERAGAMSLHLPGVHDANYMVFHVRRISADGTQLTRDERYAIDYGAYARASLVFDGRRLRPGRNVISIGRTPRLRGTNDHYAFKQIRLQLRAAVPD